MNFYAGTVQELIDAITTANPLSGGHIIHLRAGAIYVLTGVNNTSLGPSGLPVITGDITIKGYGATIRRNATPAFRILCVTNPGKLTMKGLTITGGRLDGTNGTNMNGGGIYNMGGTLIISHCKIIGNYAKNIGDGYGGGICNYEPSNNPSTLMISNSAISNNTTATGGGIYNGDSQSIVTITNSIVSDNVGGHGWGGGGFANFGGKLSVDNCVISDNRAHVTGGGLGGAIYIDGGTVTVTNSTITRNRSIGGQSVYNKPAASAVVLNYNRIFGHLGISVHNTAANRIDARYNWWGASDGPTGAGGSGDEVTATTVDTFPFITTDECEQEGIPTCPLNIITGDAVSTDNPISLRLGEKRVEATDLSLTTPASPLMFKRVYRQSKQPDYQFMGLGWSHNHAYQLIITGASPNRTAVVRLPDGGSLKLDEDKGYPGRFIARAGSNSTMEYSAGSNEYILLAQDKSQYIFDGTAVNGAHYLKRREWPSGEIWTYTHAGSDLTKVEDGYGHELQFSYYSGLGGDDAFKNGLLKRVQARNTNSTPSDLFYAELDYIKERIGGSIPGDAKALLSSITDARGNAWTYEYYGKYSSETIPQLRSRMTKRLSPSVDTTGDGTADGILTLEKLTCLSNVPLDLAVNGGMELDSDWASIPGAEPTTNECSDVQKDTGSYSRHVVASAGSQGIEGNLWNLVANKSYTISARVYPVSGVVKMQALGTTAFDRTSSGTGSWQTLSVTSFVPTATVLSCRLQFIASGAAAEFYVDTVSIVETNPDYVGITQERGGEGSSALQAAALTFAPHQNLTRETIVGVSNLHRFDQSIYLGMTDPLGYTRQQVSNNKFRPAVQVDPNDHSTWLNWDSSGKHLERVADAAGSETTFAYQTGDTLHSSADAEGRQTIYAYEDPNVPRQPTLVLVTTGSDLAVNGGMELDSGWRNVGTPTLNKRIPNADSGQYTRHVVTDAANEGIEGNSWNLEMGYTYTIRARVYPVNGVVKMQVTGTTAFDKTTSGTGTWQTLEATYVSTGSATGKKLQFVSSGGVAEFYVDSVSISRLQAGSPVVELAVNGGMELDSDWTNVATPTTNERTLGADTGLYARRVIAGAAGQGMEEESARNLVANHTYLILARVYPVSGTVRLKVSGTSAFDQSTTGTGTWKTLRAAYQPGSDLTGVRLQFLADGGAAQFYVDSVHILDDSLILRWQEFTYDSQGRTLNEKTIDPADGVTLLHQVIRAYYNSGEGSGLLQTVTQDNLGASNDVTTTYFYDGAGRIVQTNQTTTLGGCHQSRTVYDAAGNALATLCNFEPGTVSPIYPTTVAQAKTLRQRLYNPSDPDHYTDPDTNRLTLYEYDTLGRRVKTILHAEDPYQQVNLTFFDALDRTWRTISNYHNPETSPGVYEYTAPGTWQWNEVGQGWKDQSTPTPKTISHGSGSDQNVISDTVYNARGMVRLQRDAAGSTTLFGYDDAGRLVKTIQSASQPGYNNDYTGTSPDPALGSYVPGSAADRDLVVTQAYDRAGNLVKSTDVLGSVTFTIYDVLNRPVKTVHAAKDLACVDLDPGDGGYSAANDPRSDSYVSSTDPDRDLIETTEYDAMGRVIRTRRLLDNRPAEQWETTLFGYDTLGRQVKVIRSASQSAYNLIDDPDLSDYAASSSPDLDLMTQTVYDSSGRVLHTEDTLGAKTRSVYDGLGRQVRTITHYVDQGEDPALWVWDDAIGQKRWEKSDGTPVDHGANNDQNIVAETIYDNDGRVQFARDVLGRITHPVYDSASRVIRTVTNFEDQGEDPALWVWNNGWKKSNGTTPIDHGDGDLNIVSSTVYDVQGRVSETIDHRHNEMLYFYDALGRRIKTVANYLIQGSTDPADWVWNNNRWENGSGGAILFGENNENDRNRITTTTYDVAGRVIRTRDAAGSETRHEYDAVGRRTKTTDNYADGMYDPGVPDQDLISTTVYNKGGQAVSATDTRGTQTLFSFDTLRRRLTVTQAPGSPQASTTYTCYDKAGKALRTIAHWTDDPTQPVPDAKDGSGSWLFVPDRHGTYNDRDLVTAYEYDLAGRRVRVTDPQDNFTTTGYFKDGHVQSITDPEDSITQYRYDGLRRRTRVVQGYVDNGEDPALWVWDDAVGQKRWEKSDGTPIHPVDTITDQNIIVLVAYDLAGRVNSQRDPRGNETTFQYDRRDRRKSLTNPLPKTWQTAYADLTTGGTRVTMTYPGISGAPNYPVQRDFDRLGRLASVAYGDPASTPDVKLAYDPQGNRQTMSEYSGANFTNPIRGTHYTYDARHRVASIGFDNDGGGTVDETVGYQYDAGGLRTRLTLPGDLSITYLYDIRGRLVSLADWDGHTSQFGYDAVGRHIATTRYNGLCSRYEYDPAGRLRHLRHHERNKLLARLVYDVDGRGNRTQAYEQLARPATTVSTIDKANAAVNYYRGTWSDSGSFKVSSQFWAAMTVTFTGSEGTLTLGTGPDHSLFDIYIDGSLWESFDGYTAAAGERIINFTLERGEAHTLDIRNRSEKNKDSTGYTLRFKEQKVLSTVYDARTIQYVYDQLSRLVDADYGDRRYQYTYDRAGNRTQEIMTVGGTPTTTNYTYNGANQIANTGFAYDDNGNLTSDGADVYTWDRANRLTSMGGISYAYDGLGSRISQTANSIVTRYLLDYQPALVKVLTAITGPHTTHYVHGPRGILAYENNDGSWAWMAQDGLNSVMMELNDALAVNTMQHYAPYGGPFGTLGSFGSYQFTGEHTDANGLVYLRNRYYVPGLGVFPSLDAVEGNVEQIMTLNRYGYVAGNVISQVDPSGMIAETPGIWDSCFPTQTGRNCQCYDNTKRVIQGLPPYTNSYFTAAEACSQGFPGYPECPPATPIPTNTFAPGHPGGLGILSTPTTTPTPNPCITTPTPTPTLPGSPVTPLPTPTPIPFNTGLIRSLSDVDIELIAINVFYEAHDYPEHWEAITNVWFNRLADPYATTTDIKRLLADNSAGWGDFVRGFTRPGGTQLDPLNLTPADIDIIETFYGAYARNPVHPDVAAARNGYPNPQFQGMVAFFHINEEDADRRICEMECVAAYPGPDVEANLAKRGSLRIVWVQGGRRLIMNNGIFFPTVSLEANNPCAACCSKNYP